MINDFDSHVFIFGFLYDQKRRKKYQPINFMMGQAKVAVAFGSGLDCDVSPVFKGLVKLRVKVDFMFYSTVQDYEGFRRVWDYDWVLCTIDGGVLTFVWWYVGVIVW